jgi:hypothetical protein
VTSSALGIIAAILMRLNLSIIAIIISLPLVLLAQTKGARPNAGPDSWGAEELKKAMESLDQDYHLEGATERESVEALLQKYGPKNFQLVRLSLAEFAKRGWWPGFDGKVPDYDPEVLEKLRDSYHREIYGSHFDTPESLASAKENGRSKWAPTHALCEKVRNVIARKVDETKKDNEDFFVQRKPAWFLDHSKSGPRTFLFEGDVRYIDAQLRFLKEVLGDAATEDVRTVRCLMLFPYPFVDSTEALKGFYQVGVVSFRPALVTLRGIYKDDPAEYRKEYGSRPKTRGGFNGLKDLFGFTRDDLETVFLHAGVDPFYSMAGNSITYRPFTGQKTGDR